MRTCTGFVSYDAELLKDAGLFIAAVSRLIDNNSIELDFDDGKPFMNSFHISGLMTGLRMISDQLTERGEYIDGLIGTKQEEIAPAALERRQSENTLDDTNMRQES